MEPLRVLPKDLSQPLLGFLNEHFKTPGELSKASALSAKLKKECVDLDRNLLDLQDRFSEIVSNWISRSKNSRRTLYQLSLKLRKDERRDESSKRMGKILVEDLPLLAKEVSRIETVRVYAETTLRLEALVGDLEDVACSFMSQNPRNIFSINPSVMPNGFGLKQEKLMLSVKAIKDIEDELARIVKWKPKWNRLLMAVDSRVDRTLAILRPQAIADHRSLILSFGWPPPLSDTNQENGKSLEFRNPLVLMQGSIKERYSRSFLALCFLQHLQMQRQARQLGVSSLEEEYQFVDFTDWHKKLYLDQALWVIDELVMPIASRAEHHFSRWVNNPKFIFAFVYKITRDIAGGLDEILQPLVDKAMLRGYSAKESWVSSMVKMLCGYLSKQMFPSLVSRYHKNGLAEVSSSWLHLIDLIITFNKQMLAVAGTVTAIEFDGSSQRVSILSIFRDNPGWLKIWAQIELNEAKSKLKSEIKEVGSWNFEIGKKSKFISDGDDESFLLSTREDFKAPLIAEFVAKMTWGMIERSRSLPSISSQILFIRLAPAKFLHRFFNILHLRCQEAELSVSYEDDSSLNRVAGSINSARYCESVLQEWCEDVNFLEMSVNGNDPDQKKMNGLDIHGCVFGDEMEDLRKLQTDWLAEIMAVLLRQFDYLSWDYVQVRKPWEQVQEDFEANPDSKDVTVCMEFVEALDSLKDRLCNLKMVLNSKDFHDLWRSVAGGIDLFIFSSISLSDTKFTGHGIDQFVVDMGALFSVFRLFCTRPEAFFPFTSNSLKLLTMNWGDVRNLQSAFKSEKKLEFLKHYGVFHVSAAQAEKILRNRTFEN